VQKTLERPIAWLVAEGIIPPPERIEYPESDGAPLGETGFHVNVIFYLLQALRLFFRHREDVFVAADMFFYYEEGDPSAVTAPDVFVVKGVSKRTRRTFKMWEEKAGPCVVFEVTSRSSRLEDIGSKRALYEMLGVQEYYLFDPLADYLLPQLQGFSLQDGYYYPMEPAADDTVFSPELGLILKPAGQLLRLVDPSTGEELPTLDEAVEATAEALRLAKAEAQRAKTEAQRAARAEAEAARLRAELAAIRSQK